MRDRHADKYAPLSLTDQLRRKSQKRRRALEDAPAPLPNAPMRNDLMPRLELCELLLDNLKPSSRKLRKIDQAHVREVSAAIATLGFCVPILVGRESEIIDGEVRYLAAREVGMERVPCLRIGHLSSQNQRLLRLAVNRLAEKGQWDLDELKLEFEELILHDVPIEIAGFSLDEIDHIALGDANVEPEAGPLELRPDAVAVSRPGDIFQLGPHRLICGDATKPETLGALMQGMPAVRLLMTDEPYNVKIAGHVTGGSHREFAMASGEMSDAEFLAFNRAWMQAAAPYLADGALFGTFIDWRGYPIVHTAATSLGLNPLNLITWVKTNAGQGSFYRSQHELFPIFKNGDARHVNNIDLGKRGRWRSNVWNYPGASSLGSDARRGLKDHPTVKPVAMLEDALLDLSNRGDLVLDPFLGSGSTLLAAEKTGRTCIAIELDPLYVDLAIRRWQKSTGADAVLPSDGLTFDEVAEVRLANELP